MHFKVRGAHMTGVLLLNAVSSSFILCLEFPDA
jgi:hypothetical protein